MTTKPDPKPRDQDLPPGLLDVRFSYPHREVNRRLEDLEEDLEDLEEEADELQAAAEQTLEAR